MKNIYLDNGYLNTSSILENPNVVNDSVNFVFVIGGRGIGKTYGFLKEMIEKNKHFILLRRTQAQVDVISKPQFSPFKSVCADMGITHDLSSLGKYQTGVWFENDSEMRAYICALSTFSNIRGFDASDIEFLIYDEFIPERHERAIKNEASAFFNVCETIGRNRELMGKPPLKVICLSNSSDLANPIFMELKLVNTLSKMIACGRSVYENFEKGVCIIACRNSPISEMKKETSLYKLTRGTSFQDMALENEFTGNVYVGGKSRNLKEYKPVVQVGEITIYKHKSKNEFYVCSKLMGTPIRAYELNDADKRRFRRYENSIFTAYVNRLVDFETPTDEVLFLIYFDAY